MLPKKVNKRKVKNNVKKIARYLGIAILLFSTSFALLFLFFFPRQKIISPVSYAFTNLMQQLTLHTDDLDMIKIKENLQKNNIAVMDMQTGPDGIIVALESGEEVAFSKTKDITVQIASLQLTMAHLTIEGKHISRIDLRFDRPVVVYQK